MTATKVVRTPVMPTMETLLGCRDGLTKRIKNAKKKVEKARLRDIREEIDFLIEAL